MKRFSPFLLALLLVACGSSPDAEKADSEQAAYAEEAASETLARPDADHPVNENLEVPLGWKVRLDDPASDAVVGADTATADIWFVTMKPGWHIRMKSPRAIFYHPASTASGSYSVSSKIHLFPPGRRNEGYGLIFGGQNLGGDDQTYLYFLLRRSGEFLVKRRIGDEFETLVGWEANDAIVPYTDETEGTIVNTLGLDVSESTLTFKVNGVDVHSMPKDGLETDGLVGFRLNHGVNVHVETFDVAETG